MELFLVYIGVQVLIESIMGTKTVFSILFLVFFLLTQLIVMVLVTIDLVIRIIRCCKNRYDNEEEKEEPTTGTKLRSQMGEKDYFDLDRKRTGKALEESKQDHNPQSKTLENESKDNLRPRMKPYYTGAVGDSSSNSDDHHD